MQGRQSRGFSSAREERRLSRILEGFSRLKQQCSAKQLRQLYCRIHGTACDHSEYYRTMRSDMLSLAPQSWIQGRLSPWLLISSLLSQIDVESMVRKGPRTIAFWPPTILRQRRQQSLATLQKALSMTDGFGFSETSERKAPPRLNRLTCQRKLTEQSNAADIYYLIGLSKTCCEESVSTRAAPRTFRGHGRTVRSPSAKLMSGTSAKVVSRLLCLDRQFHLPENKP
jgi:hypothetical protein